MKMIKLAMAMTMGAATVVALPQMASADAGHSVSGIGSLATPGSAELLGSFGSSGLFAS